MYLRKVDKPAYNSIRCSHQDISKFALSNVKQHQATEAHKAWFAKDPDRARTSSFHLGGIRSMSVVSISAGAGIIYHYDKGDNIFQATRLTIAANIYRPFLFDDPCARHWRHA